MREFERKALLLRLAKADWAIDHEQTDVIRAHKAVSADSPWPFAVDPALPWPQSEILVVGCVSDFSRIDCRDDSASSWQYSVRGDGVVLRSELAKQLAAERGYAISVGRTHTDNSPGLSVLGPEGWLDPESLVEHGQVVGLHRGADAARAWSYGRVSL